jgi:hypothetical protein
MCFHTIEDRQMKIKTSELTGAALDWAVAKCEKLDTHTDKVYDDWNWEVYVDFTEQYCNVLYTPSSVWGWGGPIIERECMDILCLAGGDDGWQADKYLPTEKVEGYGPTPLIAAMRCYCASKLGDTVDIPKELL